MRALLLPGRAYPPTAPLLWFTRLALTDHGYDVTPAWSEATDLDGDPDGDPDAWVRARAEAVGGPVDLVVGKSLGTRGASWAAELGCAAIWLTPLLLEPTCVAGIRASSARQLLVGGLADDVAWDAEVAASLHAGGCDVLEVPDADHAMAVPGAAVRTAEIQLEVTRAVDLFLRSLP